jgi:2-(1,2-epoxy-1,2-dihydrophenyl)acetyl-CoA isomerase
MTEPSPPPLIVTRDDAGVLRLQLNRPKARNAINWALRRELVRVLRETALDPDVRAVVIAGDERAFCAGGDVKEMGNGTADTSAKLVLAKVIVETITGMPQPVVAEVRGFASGAGFGLALACDVLLVDETAVFQSAFVTRGLVPDFGTSYLLTRAVGVPKAKEIILSGRDVTAAEAVQLGIAARMFPSADLRAGVDAVVAGLAASSLTALGLSKRLVDGAPGRDLSTALDHERLSQLIAAASDEHAAYLAAVKAGAGAGLRTRTD